MGLQGNGITKSSPRIARENLSKPTLLASFQMRQAGQLQNFSEETRFQNHPQISPSAALACLLLLAALASTASVEAPCGLHCT